MGVWGCVGQCLYLHEDTPPTPILPLPTLTSSHPHTLIPTTHTGGWHQNSFNMLPDHSQLMCMRLECCCGSCWCGMFHLAAPPKMQRCVVWGVWRDVGCGGMWGAVGGGMWVEGCGWRGAHSHNNNITYAPYIHTIHTMYTPRYAHHTQPSYPPTHTFPQRTPQVARRVVLEGWRPPLPETLPGGPCPPRAELESLMKHCWAQSPEDRPTAAAVVKTLEGIVHTRAST